VSFERFVDFVRTPDWEFAILDESREVLTKLTRGTKCTRGFWLFEQQSFLQHDHAKAPGSGYPLPGAF
jgi:hypothetical protein